jgi:DnaJ like chaperone protein
MQWLGKAVGGALGFAVAGPYRFVGLVLGVVLGHQFDTGFAASGKSGAKVNFRSQKTQQIFFEMTFSVMGHIAKVDGRVAEENIRVARLIMHRMELLPEQVQQAIAFFTTGKGANFRRADALGRLQRRLRGQRDLVRAFMEIQLQAALATGKISKSKRELLWVVAKSLDMGRVELAQVEAFVRAQQFRASGQHGGKVGLEDAFRVLGLEHSAGDKEVKTAYRRLMSQHHPDKLVARGLPLSMKRVAEQRTQEIRAAYDRIKQHRGFT